MKPWKQMVLIAGIAGLIGLFLPLVEVRHGPIALGFSAKQLSFGMETEHALLDAELPAVAKRLLPRRGKVASLAADLRSTRRDVRLVADASRGAALAFAPAALMLALAAIGLLRRGFGRLSGALALLLGLASIGAWLGLRYVIRYALDEGAWERTTVTLQLGGHLLLVAGALSALAGLGALFSPDRGVTAR